MTKFLVFDVEAADLDSENAGNIKLSAVLFAMQPMKQGEDYKGFRPEKLDELLLFIKPKEKFQGGIMDVMCLYEYDGMDKFDDLFHDADIILTDKEYLVFFCALQPISRIIFNVREMAKCLIKDFEMEQGENMCEIIMNTISLIWEKQTFIYIQYSVLKNG
jgi:hypothetical protein